MREQANVLADRAYRHQQHGEIGHAIALYRRSIATYPTPEAHTWLGWAYALMERYDEAIAECEKAIALDPGFGNPYNDIGAYLIEQGRPEEAIPWLEQAIIAPRYATPQFALVNIGRAWEHLGEAHSGPWPPMIRRLRACAALSAGHLGQNRPARPPQPSRPPLHPPCPAPPAT